MDHLRASAFLISDGVVPSNVGRGYVLRRIIRRAVRYGHKLGMNEPFLTSLYPDLCDIMGEAYPNLIARSSSICTVIENEERSFHVTLNKGLHFMDTLMSRNDETRTLSGEDVFKLYDTYGIPVDLTEVRRTVVVVYKSQWNVPFFNDDTCLECF